MPTTTASSNGNRATSARTKAKRPARASRTSSDQGNIGTFVAGAALGAMLGASVALLFAPSRGSETRQGLRRKLWEDRDSVWQKLGDELKKAGALRGKGDVEEVEELV